MKFSCHDLIFHRKRHQVYGAVDENVKRRRRISQFDGVHALKSQIFSSFHQAEMKTRKIQIPHARRVFIAYF